jgi:hypothetical protein
MPVVYQKFIFRADLRANPDVLYLFGDNEQRQGKGGQAKEMRGEPNAVGVRTKAKPATTSDSYWTDENSEQQRAMIDSDLEPARRALSAGRVVVVPLDGLGTGLSELNQRAPMTDFHLRREIVKLEQIKPDPKII